MASYLVTGRGAGKLAVGEVVDLSDRLASFYAAKLQKVAEPKVNRLEVGTPKPKPLSKRR